MVAIVTLSVVIDLLVGDDSMEAERDLHSFYELPGNVSRSTQRGDGPDQGLELMVDRGIGCGPAASASSARPMQAPESRPVQGTPSISGMSGFAAVVVNGSGEFGTRYGMQVVVNTSASSPAVHAATGDTVPAGGAANAMTTGAAKADSAKAPPRISRRNGG
jgi:hypothetical protein